MAQYKLLKVNILDDGMAELTMKSASAEDKKVRVPSEWVEDAGAKAPCFVEIDWHKDEGNDYYAPASFALIDEADFTPKKPWVPKADRSTKPAPAQSSPPKAETTTIREVGKTELIVEAFRTAVMLASANHIGGETKLSDLESNAENIAKAMLAVRARVFKAKS